MRLYLDFPDLLEFHPLFLYNEDSLVRTRPYVLPSNCANTTSNAERIISILSLERIVKLHFTDTEQPGFPSFDGHCENQRCMEPVYWIAKKTLMKFLNLVSLINFSHGDGVSTCRYRPILMTC